MFLDVTENVKYFGQSKVNVFIKQGVLSYEK